MQPANIGHLYDICFDSLGERVAGASSGGVYIWSHSAGTFTASLATQISGAHATSVSWGAPEHGSPLVCGNVDGSIFVWEPNFRVESDGVEAFSRLDPSFRIAANGRTISCVRFAPAQAAAGFSGGNNSCRFAAGGDDGHVRVYESILTASGAAHLGSGVGGGGSSWQLIQEFDAGAGAITALAWAPGVEKDAPILAVACVNSLSIWSLTASIGGTASSTASSTTQAVSASLSLNFAGALSSSSSWVYVADLHGAATPAVTLAWAPRGGRSSHLLASASAGGVGGSGIALWRVASEGAPIFHPKTLIGAGAALYVRHAPAATLAIAPLTLIECGGSRGVDCVAFSFEGALIASLSGEENRLTFREGPGGVWMPET